MVPQPCRFDLSVAVNRPPAAMYALLADVQDAEPIPRRAVVRMVKGPPGRTLPGTVWHESVPRRFLRPLRRALERQLRPRLRERLDDLKQILESEQDLAR